MAKFKSDFLNTLDERGFIHQCSDTAGLDALAAKGEAIAYVGYDCTAPSLHIGNFLTIMMLYWLQQSGNKPITLMGGGTSKIGDPSFKDEARKLLTVDLIQENVASIKRVFERFLTFGDGPTDAIMVDNADWLDKLEYIPFLRDIGQHFSVNRMLSFDSVKLRLDREQSLSFLEFNYMILQAYDFLELSRRSDCRLQMGGSDQWGNIVNGIELGRRIAVSSPEERTVIKSPADAANLLMYQLAALDQEYLFVILLDTRNRVMGKPFEVYHGSLNTSLIRVGEVFREAVKTNAAALIVAHNHPSGDPSPSPEDVAVTRALVEAGKLLDIDVLDHLVIGHHRFVSLKERGLGFSRE